MKEQDVRPWRRINNLDIPKYNYNMESFPHRIAWAADISPSMMRDYIKMLRRSLNIRAPNQPIVMPNCTECNAEVDRKDGSYKEMGLCGKCAVKPDIRKHREMQNLHQQNTQEFRDLHKKLYSKVP